MIIYKIFLIRVFEILLFLRFLFMWERVEILYFFLFYKSINGFRNFCILGIFLVNDEGVFGKDLGEEFCLN